MKKILILALSLICSSAMANDIGVIDYSKESRDNQEKFFLIGTPNGNYIIKSWQFNIEKSSWDGTGEPSLSVGKAITKAYEYFNKTTLEVGVKNVEFKPAFSRKGTIIWYYLVTLTTLPYKFDSDEFEIVVLLSGEILKAKGK